MLSLRLKAVYDLIPNDSEIINIGTDHALLEIDLYKQKNVSCVGIDINQESIDRCMYNLKKNNLKGKIKILKNDGLNNIEVKNEIIVLSGLGTRIILKILKNINNNDLIIQSNNSLSELRKKICSKGYYIDKEVMVFDKKWYVTIYFKKGSCNYNEFDYYCGIKKDNKNYIDYLIRLNVNLYNNIPVSEQAKRVKVNDLIEQLKKVK